MGLLCKGAQDELPLRDANMRDRETGMLNVFISINENIQIDIPRTLVNELLTAQCALNILQLVEESKGLKFSLDLSLFNQSSSDSFIQT